MHCIGAALVGQPGLVQVLPRGSRVCRSRATLSGQLELKRAQTRVLGSLFAGATFMR